MKRLKDLIQLKANKPTRKWRRTLPLMTKILLFRSFYRIDRALEKFINLLLLESKTPTENGIMKIVEETINQLNKIDGGGGVIETVEREDLCEFIETASRLAGLKIDGSKDITAPFRDW